MMGIGKLLSLRESRYSMGEYKDEFVKTRMELNIKRCKITCIFLLILNFILILVDLLLYKPMRAATPAYTYLYYSHIAVSALVCLWLLTWKFNTLFLKKSRPKLMYQILLNIVIYWGVFMGLNDLNISGQISAYITCVLGMSLIMYVSPAEGFVTYFSSFIIFTVGLIFSVSDIKILYSHIVNAAIAIACSYVFSRINFSAFRKDFLNKKIILKNRMELEASYIKLREYEKLRTDFFANISHELRTPLNIIYSSQQMIELSLENKNNDTKKINRYLKMMKQNSFRLIRLVSNLIDITKIDATIFEISPVNCNIIKIVEDITLSVVDYVESKGISLTFDTEVEEKTIACDPDKIERIILNLLSNAIKFTHKGGSIFVNIYLKDDKVYISVKDTGIGISDEMKELIFDRFIQVDKSISRNREGSGIGLSLVKSLVELHNGSISVNSRLGQGSEFIVSLPDIMVENSCDEEYINCLNDQRVEKINIEFSDIY